MGMLASVSGKSDFAGVCGRIKILMAKEKKGVVLSRRMILPIRIGFEVLVFFSVS